ncbi:hypothetical protein ACFPOI_28105 [Nonomuraea angiospora]|uniref:CPBP family intramembrane metalloprotease n=1 Tax=Nonomuraea angiospora TaxID=46172 RepID=A0ABR9LPW8_9ACTN|nr:hypothetical protein [Nonomuraea angiospora]MBE1582131.1 hypothetical protein [Nonomuraea angiospora]
MNPAGPRVPPLAALAVGVALWFVPTAVQRVLWLTSGGDTVNFDVVLLSRWLAAALLLCVGAHAITNLLILANA